MERRLGGYRGRLGLRGRWGKSETALKFFSTKPKYGRAKNRRELECEICHFDREICMQWTQPRHKTTNTSTGMVHHKEPPLGFVQNNPVEDIFFGNGALVLFSRFFSIGVHSAGKRTRLKNLATSLLFFFVFLHPCCQFCPQSELRRFQAFGPQK